MTTPQPAALPELPETDYRLGFCDEGGDQLLGLSGYTADQMDARYLRGYNDALAALQSQPAAAVVSDEPDLASKVVNDSCWKFVEAMPHQLPGPIWNDLKPALYAALMHYHRAILALRPQSTGETFDQWLKREQPAGAVSDMERGWNACAASLRPQAVPMTEHERGNQVMEHLGPAALTGGRMSVLDAFNLGIDAAEAHHGITAQGGEAK